MNTTSESVNERSTRWKTYTLEDGFHDVLTDLPSIELLNETSVPSEP